MKKLITILALLASCGAIVFVLKETLFFDELNPYGAKELDPDFARRLPPGVVTSTDPITVDAFAGQIGPLEPQEARRIAVEFLTAEWRRSGLEPVRFVLIAESKKEGDLIFEFTPEGRDQTIRVKMDRLGRFQIMDPMKI